MPQQTMEQRVRTQKLKDKRKAALDARLAKVRERKLKKLKASGEQGGDSMEESEQTEEKEQKALDVVGATITEQGVEESSLDKEEEKVISSRRPVRKADLPEWAQHKISKSLCSCTIPSFSHLDFCLAMVPLLSSPLPSPPLPSPALCSPHFIAYLFLFTEQPDNPRSSLRTDPRSERDEQFAPPTFYYEECNTGQNTKNTWKESQKLFNQKNEINNKRRDLQNESRDILHKEEQNEHKPQEQQQQLRQPLLSQPVPPPPPEFPLLPPPPQEFVQAPWTGYQWRPPPNMPPPPLPHQLPWQPNFPFNVPPPQSLWQTNMPPWQPYQSPPTMGAGPVSSAHAAWSGNPSSSNTSLPGSYVVSDGGVAISAAGNSDTKTDQCRDRTVPTTQQLSSFVAQFRSST